jgi:hypothetical protein
MKIGIIGNMNNGHFGLMRYLHDLDYDVNLLLFVDDGIKTNSHFIPENDTWNYEKWESLIFKTKLNNGSLLGLLNLVINYRINKDILKKYDILIGNGFSPAICFLYGLKLHLFIPYRYGVEYTHTQYERHTVFTKIKDFIILNLQRLGLKHSTNWIGTVDTTTLNLKTIEEIGLKYKVKKLALPMLYLRDQNFGTHSFNSFTQFKLSVKNRYPIIFSHVSHVKALHGHSIKRNDILIDAFSKYIRRNPESNSVLVLVDYGDAVDNSKKLIFDLGISQYVHWLPKMSRKHLLPIIKEVDLGCAELGGAFFGSTGFEFIALGIPFFQNMGMDNNEFKEKNGYELPPLFNVNNADQICDLIENFEKGKIDNKIIKFELQKWFDDKFGSQAAKDIINTCLEKY